MVQAINLALREAMARDQKVVILGQDVGINGGVFRVTEGLRSEFGEERVIDTPLAESAIVGSSVGMAINGLRPICELQFSGFSYQGFYQLEQHAGRMRNRTRGRYTCPMVVRIPYGGGIRALEHHSESREAYFAHTPGLKMVIPSGPRKARALLLSAVDDPDECTYDMSACVNGCGNDTIEGTEVCDGEDLDSNDCTTVPGTFVGGDLNCLDDCTDFDTSGCISA